MAELTEKDRANLYKMAQGIEARLVKQGYKKGTAEFKAAFARAAKGVSIAGRTISETGKIMRSRPAPVKTTKKAAAKPAAATPKPSAPKPPPSASKAPDQPVRSRGVSGAQKAAIAGGAALAAGAAAAGGRAVYNRSQTNARVDYLRAYPTRTGVTSAPRSMRSPVKGAVARVLRGANVMGGGGGGRSVRGGGPKRHGR